LQAHQEAGIKYLVWPWIGKEQRASIENYKLLADKLNTIGDFCSQIGMEFGYHNHDFEFYPTDGEIPYDVLLNYTDPELVFMEIDLYWIAYAGKDPIAYFERYPGRFKLWHVKDMAAGESMEMTEVGSGIIDYEEIFQHTSLAGMKEFFIEQDTIQGDGFESVKESFDYMNNIL
jgi:sugar phosphate isomerase/epimerase